MRSFSTTVYANRIQQAQRLCESKKLDGVIIGTGAQLAYLTGCWASTHERLTALVIPATGTPRFILPQVDRASLTHSPLGSLDLDFYGWVDGDNPYEIAAAAFVGKHDVTIGVGSDLSAHHLLTLQALLPGATFALATSVLAEMFVAKDPAEIAELERAGKAIDRVHAQVPALLQAGRTEREVAADIERLILSEHELVDFIIVGSQANGANPHHDYSDRVLETGDMVVVDIGGSLDTGYHSDCTRTYCVGGPNALAGNPHAALAKDLYDVLFEAQQAAVDAVRPGARAEDIDRAAREIIQRAGYGDDFIHRTGHGIGLSTHEEPFIIEGNALVLEEGMAFSVEPGIYIEGKVGARIEDIVVVTATGCRQLNNQPRNLL